jgi:predicted DNA-binding transcriptional regulator YafY
MPTNKNASIRYQALDKCFRDRRHRYYIEDLIDRCEDALVYYNGVGGVSRRQIFEDIKFMESDTGWSIPLERVHDGKKVYYRYEDPKFTINEQPLTDEEAQQLRTAIVTISRFRGLPSNEWMEEVISNLEWRFNLKGNNDNVIGFEQNNKLKGLVFLNTILDATSNHQTLNICYHNYKYGGREINLTLHPYYVKQYNERWFVFGLNQQNGLLNNLALDRIKHLEIAENVPFIPNTAIEFEHFFDDVVGVTIPLEHPEKEKITIKLSPERFPYVVSKPLHHSQQVEDENEHLLSIDVRANRELDQLILSFGPDIEIVKPQWYRERISALIADSYKKYVGVQVDCTEDV